MTADKRSVATDALETLGYIIDDGQRRDAIHLAVEPVIASEELRAGQAIGLMPDGTAGTNAPHVGIVDPFLKIPVKPGQRFWLVVFPRRITSLRHVWDHPAFPTTDSADLPKGASIRWLQNFAAQAGISYDELMWAADDYLKRGEYLCEGGRWEGFGNPDELWDHYAVVTGTPVAEAKRGSFFTCSC